MHDGSRVHLRVARSSDAAPIRELFTRRSEAGGSGSGDLQVARLVNFDPRERCVLTATALVDGAETVVGAGSIGLDDDPGPDPRPELVVVDPDAPDGLDEML